MNNKLPSTELTIDSAINYAKSGNIESARLSIGLSAEDNDEIVLNTLMSIEKALYLFRNQKHLEAHEYFKKALPVIEKCSDSASKQIIITMSKFSEGLVALYNGDAHLATKLFSVSSSDIEKICFLIPEFELSALSYKAASLIALARAHINAADISTAEKILGRVRNIYDEYLNNLDPMEDKHAIGFAEVYGLRCEIAFQFIVLIDLPSLDLDNWDNRLKNIENDIKLLKKYIHKIPDGPIWCLINQYPSVYSIFKRLNKSLKIITYERRPFKKEEIENLVKIDEELFNSKQEILKSGNRGKGLIFIIDQLLRLHNNLLKLGKSATRDFGKFSSVIAFIFLSILVIIIHLTIKPSGFYGVLCFFLAFIISLVSGFGFGALRFIPLIKLFSDAINNSHKE